MKKSNLVFCAVSCASVIAGASGCGLMKNMDEMHDASMHLATTTDQMNQQMTQTNHKIDDTNTTTKPMATDVHATACIAGETYAALRQGNTLQARAGDDQLAQLNDAHAIEDKIFHAGAYMKAFEFQIWNCADPDSDSYLKEFYQEAAEEFTRVLPNYLSTDHSKWSVDPTSTGNAANNLYAIAVTVQELNANIVTAYKLGKWKDQPQSMLDLIQHSFTNKVFLAAHPEQTTLMDREFLANEPLLIQLFQVRMNFLAAMSLAKVSSLEDHTGKWNFKGLWNKFKMRFGKPLFGPWETQLPQMGSDNDLERIRLLTRFLYGSNDIRAYMESIGVTPILDSNIRAIYAAMRTSDVVKPEIQNPKSDADLAFNNTQEALKRYLEQLDIFYGHKPFYKIPTLDHPDFYAN